MSENLKKSENKKPWPTKDAMEQIYELNLWGGNSNEFYSGEGSHNPDIVLPYIEVVKSFLESFESKLTVCDLGCGDFNVGVNLLEFTKSYIAVDIAENLIERNKVKFSNDKLEFQCLDIAKDNLPIADLALVRQVLQHLSNTEVLSVINKLKAYKYVILTEHIPIGEFEPNRDIISGQGIRIKKGSGLDITLPPFNFCAKKETQLSSTILNDGKGIIVTTLYEV